MKKTQLFFITLSYFCTISLIKCQSYYEYDTEEDTEPTIEEFYLPPSTYFRVNIGEEIKLSCDINLKNNEDFSESNYYRIWKLENEIIFSNGIMTSTHRNIKENSNGTLIVKVTSKTLEKYYCEVISHTNTKKVVVYTLDSRKPILSSGSRFNTSLNVCFVFLLIMLINKL